MEIEYDLFNRMVRYEKGTDVYTYTYNGDGQRLSKTVNGVTTEFTWDGMDMILESSGSVASIYVYGNGINYRKTGNSVYTYTTNAHGDVVNYVQGTAVVKEYCYDAFGNELEEYDNTETDNPFRYCGEYYDVETGLYYLRNRYYDPQTGRFITEDPIKDGDNWYVYCNGNPVMFSDPTGFKSIYVVVFSGINTQQGGFDQVTPEIARQIYELYPDATVNYKTIYPFGNGVVSDSATVVDLAQDGNVKLLDNMAKEVMDNYHGEEEIYFLGYSGGGVAASKVAERLDSKWNAYISHVTRVGSPKLYVDKQWWAGRTSDFIIEGDPIPAILLPHRGNGKGAVKETKVNEITTNNDMNEISGAFDKHTSYFRTDIKDANGVNNLNMIVSRIIKSWGLK